MIKSRDEMPAINHHIDLSGPEGNAFVLIGYAMKMAKDILQMNDDETDELRDEMMSGDYEHLIEVFEKHFGDWVVLYR